MQMKLAMTSLYVVGLPISTAPYLVEMQLLIALLDSLSCVMISTEFLIVM